MYRIGLCKGCKARQEKLAAAAKHVTNKAANVVAKMRKTR